LLLFDAFSNAADVRFASSPVAMRGCCAWPNMLIRAFCKDEFSLPRG